MESNNYQPNELVKFLFVTSENENIDAKGPMVWDGAVESAKLAKDIAAFANSRDGGVLVIGKSELDNGSFDLVGLSEKQAKSFETTKVANWVNSRFDPPIRLQCHRVEHDGKTFVILTVAEFEEVPAICTKSFQDPVKSKAHHIRERTIYVRNSNAESAPLSTADDLRKLIGIATGKRGQEMLSMFDSMLKGRSLLPKDSDVELFEKELKRILEGLESTTLQGIDKGSWRLVIRPNNYVENLFDGDKEKLEKLIQKHSVRLQREFPPYQTDTHQREWGIANEGVYRVSWSLAFSGQFVLWRPYRENDVVYESRWRDMRGNPTEPQLEGGAWIDFKPSIFTIMEFMIFARRFIEEFDSSDTFELEIIANALRGRRLVTTDSNTNLDMTDPCRADRFKFRVAMNVAEFRSDWESKCVDAMKRFIDFFPGQFVERATLSSWIEKFKNREA